MALLTHELPGLMIWRQFQLLRTISQHCAHAKDRGLKASMLHAVVAVGTLQAKRDARPGHRVTIRDNHSRP